VVHALGGEGSDVHTVTLVAVPGVAADAHVAAFEPAIFKPRGVRWQQRDIEGRSVWWAEAKATSRATTSRRRGGRATALSSGSRGSRPGSRRR
jgi:hypothetical protein